MAIFVLGKSASGKSTVVKKLMKHGFHSVILYTTRPMRDGELDGVDYHFISDEEFKQKIDEDFFAEWKVYHTAKGDWYYGTSLEDLKNADDNSLVILPPDRCVEAFSKMEKKPIVLYIYANNSTIKNRLKARGDNTEEADRRIKADNEDFKNVNYMSDRIFYNNENKKLDDIVKEIIDYLKEKRGDA